LRAFFVTDHTPAAVRRNSAAALGRLTRKEDGDHCVSDTNGKGYSSELCPDSPASVTASTTPYRYTNENVVGEIECA
jgi:hypothetical protein